MPVVADLRTTSVDASSSDHRAMTTRVHKTLNAAVHSTDYANLHDAAADSAEKQRPLIIAPGLHALSSTLDLTYHTLMLPGSRITSSASPAVRVGSSGVTTSDLNIELDQVVRSGSRWLDTLEPGSDVGVQLMNWQRGLCRFRAIAEFSIGLSLEGRGSGFGSASNRIFGQGLLNNAISFRAQADAGAWVSELRMDVNQWLLGNALGTDIEGTILCDIQTANGSWHITGNVEGDASAYMLKTNGNYGYFDLRWEVDAGTARAHFGPNAHRNVLVGHSVSNLIGNITTEYEGTRNRLEYTDADGALVTVLV